MVMVEKSVEVLLVEDDETHAMLIMRCFGGIEVNNIHWVGDGEEALDYLMHRGKHENRVENPRPDLILLDLRLPKRDGHEVLKDIKNSDDLRTIPVVILTTSKNEYDVKKAYLNHANSYLVKPLGFDEFQQMTEDLGIYWLQWNQGSKFESSS
jgi:two-component system, response regulator